MSFDGTTNLVWYMGARYAYSPETWLVEDNTEYGRSAPRGFAPLPPISAIGVYESPERASWPVSHPVTIKCNSLTYKKK